MNKKERINKQVDQTLELMDRLETLEAGPYFYTRLQARLREAERETGNRLIAIFNVRRLQPALLLLLLVINIVSAVFFLAAPKTAAPGQEDYSTYAAAFLEDYTLDTNSYDTDVTEKMTGEND